MPLAPALRVRPSAFEALCAGFSASTSSRTYEEAACAVIGPLLECGHVSGVRLTFSSKVHTPVTIGDINASDLRTCGRIAVPVTSSPPISISISSPDPLPQSFQDALKPRGFGEFQWKGEVSI